MKETTKEMIAIMQAYCDGEIIEFSPNNSNSWKEVNNPFWDWGSIDYRIKPEPQYIPFNFNDALSLISRIVKTKNGKFIGTITCTYAGNNFIVIGQSRVSYDELFTDFLFLDGSICGKLK